MHDYTPEGVKYNQREIAISHLYLIDKELRKMNRKLNVATIAILVFLGFKHKDKIKKIIRMEGV